MLVGFLRACEPEVNLGAASKESTILVPGIGVRAHTVMTTHCTSIIAIRSVVVLSACPALQVYLDLQREGYLVEYQRVPVTDEKSPKERDFDLLVR